MILHNLVVLESDIIVIPGHELWVAGWIIYVGVRVLFFEVFVHWICSLLFVEVTEFIFEVIYFLFVIYVSGVRLPGILVVVMLGIGGV